MVVGGIFHDEKFFKILKEKVSKNEKWNEAVVNKRRKLSSLYKGNWKFTRDNGERQRTMGLRMRNGRDIDKMGREKKR